MFAWFRKFARGQFEKTVRNILRQNVPDFSSIEGGMPLSTVTTAYDNAWKMIGEPAHGKRPDIYRAECMRAAEYVLNFYETAAGLIGGIGQHTENDALNRCYSPHEASRRVHEFFTWQHNYLVARHLDRDILDPLTGDEAEKELAFLMGATECAFLVLQLRPSDHEILVLNVASQCLATETQFDIKEIILEMHDAAKRNNELFVLGFEAMDSFLKVGKADAQRGLLATALGYEADSGTDRA